MARTILAQKTRSDFIVKLDQVRKWKDEESTVASAPAPTVAAISRSGAFYDPLTSHENERADSSASCPFPVNDDINSKILVWRGTPWLLEVDAVVNSTNESLDESFSSPGLHAAAGPGLAEECATLGNCKTGMAKISSAYDLPARRVIHTVGPRYLPHYQTAAENALSQCYRHALEVAIEHHLGTIAVGCIYSEAKGFPRERGAHIALRTVRRFLENHGERLSSLVFCLTTPLDLEIYIRLLPLYFPRSPPEERASSHSLHGHPIDSNGDSVHSERAIRISPLPNPSAPSTPRGSQSSSFREGGRASSSRLSVYSSIRSDSSSLGTLVDPVFMAMMRDPDLRRQEQWERAAAAQQGSTVARWLGFRGLGGPALTPAEEDSLHARYLARATALALQDIAEMKSLYRGGVDVEGRPLVVIVGGHFLARAMDLNRWVLFAVRAVVGRTDGGAQEFEQIITRPYTAVYFHAATRLPPNPDFGWLKRLHQGLGRKHRHNLQVWKKVRFVDRLLDLFRFVPRDQLHIPDFVLDHDMAVNPQDVIGVQSQPQPERRRIATHFLPS